MLNLWSRVTPLYVMENHVTEEQAARRPGWTKSPLYPFLMDLFPKHRSVCQYFDVKRLASELNLSPEAVYKWMRSSRLIPANAATLLKHALSEDNIAALRETGRELPTIRDFEQFVYPIR